MYKELVISLIILIAIFTIDYFTQTYTDKVINETTQDISKLEEDIKNENVDGEKVKKDINDIYQKWLNYHPTLAYFLEHNELEKVETDFVAGKSYIESSQYSDALSELDKTKFVLKHLNEKYSFNLENIF